MTPEADKLLAAIVSEWNGAGAVAAAIAKAEAYLANSPAMVEVDVMADPRVQALVDALKHYAKDYDHERGCSMWDGGSLARAALATLQAGHQGKE